MAHDASALGATAPSFPVVGASARPVPRVEAWTLAALSGLLLLLRVAYAFAYPFDSDEPQHLHVAWAWTRGLLPYRDLFDNHTPLFHILSAPLVALIGENPRILVLMRLAMIPLFLLALLGSFLIGRRLFGTRAGLWAAVLCGLSPTFFFKSLEYRTDVLWAALWVAAVAVFISGGLRTKRGFFGGLLAGLCLLVSLKTVMLLSALLVAGASIAALALPRADRGRAARLALAALAGSALPPAALAAYFAARGALADLVYCTVEHNLLPGVGRWGYSKRLSLLVPLLGLLFLAARIPARRLPRSGTGAAFVLLLAGSQYILLSTVWPVHTRQDLLPFYPLVTVLLAGLLVARRRRGAAGRLAGGAPRTALVAAALACAEAVVLPALMPVTARGTAAQERLLSEVLALAGPDDYVLDLKGQAVFRNRPFYYALETMTLERMARGLIADTIPERCVETRTCVAPADLNGFPPRARAFLEENYLVVGRWRVAGRWLDAAATEAGRPLTFDVAIPARYAIVTEWGSGLGALDGRPYDGPRDLAAGRHLWAGPPASGRLALLWARAAERGFSPLRPKGTE